MTKNLFYIALGFIGIMGTLLAGFVDASDLVTIQDSYIQGYNELKFDDGNGNTVILLDRNLGATTTGSGIDAPEESYGEYYKHDNLHCPGGYHVPSIQEWNTLFALYSNAKYGTDFSTGGNPLIENANASDFVNEFYIPSAGYKYYDSSSNVTTLSGNGTIATLWSSSTTGFFMGGTVTSCRYKYYVSIVSGDIYNYDINAGKSTGICQSATLGSSESYVSYAVRCFKDSISPVTVTFDTDGGGDVDPQIISYNGTAVKPNNPSKEGFYFSYRTLEGSNDPFDFSTKIIENITLQAKRTSKNEPSIQLIDAPNALGYSGLEFNDGNGHIIRLLNKDITNIFGTYFQWGNNYGFSLYPSISYTEGKEVWDNQYNAGGYNNSTFRRSERDPYGWDYWQDSNNYSSNHENLWGGIYDYKNDWGLSSFNPVTGRQGPCPEGYHVPAQGEWNNLIEYWWNTYSGNYSDTIYLSTTYGPIIMSQTENVGSDFLSNFNLIKNGYLFGPSPQTSLNGMGYYRSSSPNSAKDPTSRVTLINDNAINAGGDSVRVYGYSIRCFYDSNIEGYEGTKTVTFDSRGGSEVETQVVSKDGVVREPSKPIKEGYEFDGWYVSGTNEVFQFNQSILSDVDLYARYRVVTNASIEEIDAPNALGYGGLKFDDGNGHVIKLLDRNIGTSIAGTGLSSYGDHFQWGNNYGFFRTCTCMEGSYSYCYNDAMSYKYMYCYSRNYGYSIPRSEDYNNKGINTNAFYKSQWNQYGLDIWSDSNNYSSNHENVWGGKEDYNYNRGLSSNNPTKGRQGPCPEGYHIPTQGEWNNLVKYRWNAYSGNYDGYDIEFDIENDYGSFIRKIDNNDFVLDFQNDFKLPLAGYRDGTDGNVKALGEGGYYWSSSPNSTKDPTSRRFVINTKDMNSIQANDDSTRAYGYSIRCFYNQHYVSFIDDGTVIGSGNVYDGDRWGRGIPYPSKDGYEFLGWYLEGDEQPYDFANNRIHENVTVYAQWYKIPEVAGVSIEIIEAPNALGYSGLEFNDGKGHIVRLLDRNIGAEQSGIGVQSYGYYYQWGNNYGFRGNELTGDVSEKGAKRNNSYNAKGYNSPIFIQSIRDPYGWDYWNDSNNYSSNHENLWGGIYDYKNDWGLTSYNGISGRKGPCPKGYHVPTQGEWNELIKYWRDAFSGNYNGTVYLDSEFGPIAATFSDSFSQDFQRLFKLPLAGYRYGDDFLMRSQIGYYWSSSPNSTKDPTSRIVLLNNAMINAGGDSTRSFAYPIRCFYDSNVDAYNGTKTVTFDSRGGSEVETQVVSKDGVVREPSKPIKEGYEFDGWYVSGTNEVFQFNQSILSDVDLYARYRVVTNASIEEIDAPNALGYSGIRFDDGNGHIIKLLDRNLGATEAGIECSESNNKSCGYHYQWGNNYGFAISENITSGNVSEYGARWDDDFNAKGYFSPIFIVSKRNPYGWDYWEDGNNKSSNHENLWGGIYDYNNNRGLSSDNSITGRQGPCPEGYHVPTQGEWNSLLKYWWDVNYLNYGDIEYDFNNEYGGSIKKDHDNEFLLDFQNAFKIPLAGYRSAESAALESIGEIAYLWTSSPNSVVDPTSRRFIINTKNTNSIQANDDSTRAYGYSVRCFYNYPITPETYTITFDSKGGSDIEPISMLEGETWNGDVPIPTREGYEFDAWYNADTNTLFDIGATPLTQNVTLNANWIIKQYTITFDTDGGNEISPITADYEAAITVPTDPIKNGYDFKGWNPAIPNTMPSENITIKAIREKKSQVSGGGGGGGASSHNNSNSNNGTNQQSPNITQGESVSSGTNINELNNEQSDNTSSIDEGNDSSMVNGGTVYSAEFIDAYEFSYKNRITTMDSIDKADIEGPLTRIAMAKMLSYYAINILGEKPDESRINKFNDVTEELDIEYNKAVTLAYQLGIMGINMPNNKFRPNDLVPRAEFVTALSRLLYQTPEGELEGTSEYYKPHMDKLKSKDIITNTDPWMLELRGYVMIMLMRSAK